MSATGARSVAALVVAVAAVLHLWAHVVSAHTGASSFLLATQSSGLDHDVPCSGDHHDGQAHPDEFVVSPAQYEVVAGPGWHPVSFAFQAPVIWHGPAMVGASCRSPPCGHRARAWVTRTLEVCRP
jgi:hypothetical protein